MGFMLSAADRVALRGVHPDLVRWVEKCAAASSIHFKVGEGLRSVAQQRKNVAKGVSKTMNSRHLTGHAVDLIPMVDADGDGQVTAKEQWDWSAYYKLAPILKAVAVKMGLAVEWGGDWKSFKDGPHWQLAWAQYPIKRGMVSSEVAEVAETEPKMEPKTEFADKVEKTIITGGSGTAGAGAPVVNADTIEHVTGIVAGQQNELTSGDYIRIVLAVVVVALTLYGIYRIWKKDH